MAPLFGEGSCGVEFDRMLNRFRQRWIAVAVVIALVGWALPAWADDVVWPKVRAKGLLLMDLSQQQVLYEANAGARLAP